MKRNLVLQTDFGISDGAVSAMYGVANTVDPEIRIFDLTHDIPQYNIWEGSYRLYQTVNYWPEGTVFVSVVDPGVGTSRLSIVVRTAANQYIVTPDNGTLTHIKQDIGIVEARIIDENVNRLPNSGESYTFHGRDVYAYTGARLAANVISFEEVGPKVGVDNIIELTRPKAYLEGEVVFGNIDILDIRFGNLWTNIGRELFIESGVEYGDSLEVTIENNTHQVYKNIMTYGRSFADSHLGEPLLYVNSLDNLGVAINQGSFAKAYHIETGANWKITIRKISRLISN
ncbi:DNA-directed RNA polymerase subunit delta [Virgibacillus dakarensis]|uniref:DNA-directed RNA polymerase subunit delta n=1 Tax=Lentibacillus populi TaxID=1827502 RepID=A0A9W5X794_9BACI|nr:MULTISPECIES: S-adenosyl-l-methionine hydroxide adenosyltransferase family protein [Bacillaceae]MBT2216846.1 S-adenosyl-l-methionine hydroxide adenosyltransferase family protein [Virgibacillus dakarensis]MTW86850.1 DNA-directed RNA polymerase subunit delta [Virgibacillus dakarensis]GGB59446.1 DNA-directed RNA polymerase subunit delta [Lentibacillus populi]